MHQAGRFRVRGTMQRVIFVAPIRREADYWARIWGFTPDEWIWVGKPEHLRGRYGHGRPVFVCGSQPFRLELMAMLEASGFREMIDAHDHPTDYEPRSALEHVR